MSDDVNTQGTRTTVFAVREMKKLVKDANQERAKMGKGPISVSKAIEVAAKRLRVKDLVEA